MIVGSLGDIIFEVSDSVVKTLRDATMSGSARLQEHERHLQKSLVEFCGSNACEVNFKLRLSAYLGVDVKAEKEKIVTYTESGTALVFILGTERLGEHMWMIEKYKFNLESHNGAGNTTSIDASVSLKEYAKG